MTANPDARLLASALSLPLEHAPLPADQVLAGSPTTASDAVGELGGLEIGVWEHTPGVSTDVEADEVFVVLAGRAVIRIVEEDRELAVGPGDVVRLDEGVRTVWTVTETLRKIYLV